MWLSPPRFYNSRIGSLRIYLLLVALVMASCTSKSDKEAPTPPPLISSPPPTMQTKLVLLGTGTPIPESASQGPASAVVTGNRAYLVDAGAGVIRQAQAAYENGIAPLRPDLLNILFLTHLHSDHTLGLPDVLFTPWIIGADGTLDIYGPPGTTKMISYLLLAWEDDLYIREKSKDPSQAIANHVRVHEIKAGRIYQDRNVTVTAVPVSHGKFKHAFGFKFTTTDRTIVISGDTTPRKAIADACNGCDVLLHEVYSHTGFIAGPPSWRSYHAAYHTSTHQLAELAKSARPKQLVLYHKLFFGQTEDGLVKEITDRYSGKVSLGADLDIY